MALRTLLPLAALLCCFVMSGTTHAGQWGCRETSAGARSLIFRGGIDQGEFDRFRDAFRRCFPESFAGQRTIDLDSGGGVVTEALSISRSIIDASRNGRPIETKVSQGSYCISACTYIFVSGLLRDVENGGTFEPHGFSRFSGSRIDIAIQEATGKDGTLNPAELDLQIGRLRMMARLAPVLAAQDERFAFAAQWLAEFGDPRGVRRDAPLRAAMAFAKLSSPAQQFLTLLDSGLATQLPEIERTVALSAFTRMPSLGTAASVNHFDEQAAFSWMVRTIERAAGHYLVGIKDARTFKAGDNLLVAIKSLQNEIVGIVEDSIKTGIGPYLESRQNQIDVQGLVKLMFSVSIIYTRPLTREELCDFNIVNRDCSN